MLVYLIRHPHPTRTLGVLVLPDGTAIQTLEPIWAGNEPFKSCILTGTYEVAPHLSPTKGDCFKIHDVPGRSDILIHAGNKLQDTKGCILVGMSRSGNTIRESRVALSLLFKKLPDGFTLTIL